MSKVQIICTQPGIRRNGVQHSASAIYEQGHWTTDQLKAFRADPAFIVQDVAGDGIRLSDAEISDEVQRLVTLKSAELQARFNDAVSKAAAEKLATAQAEADNAIDALGKKLTAAEATIADLQKQLETATASQGDGAGKGAAKK